MPVPSRLLVCGAVIQIAATLSACTPVPTEPVDASPTQTAPASTTQSPIAPTTRSSPLAQLERLEVKGRAPKTGYSRDQFGQRWSDDVDVQFGHNGCDTRNDILRRDLTDATLKPGTRGCVVTSGTLADPYTGKKIAFVRGSSTSQAVQIDHVVALADAWQKGAAQLSLAERTAFANDPENLQATDGATNQRKGAGDAASWLPPNRRYRCAYVARQVSVKAHYRLWVTSAERDAIRHILESCNSSSGH